MQQECASETNTDTTADTSAADNTNAREQDVSPSDALRMIREQWPETFQVSSPRPLKIGIHNEMKQTGIFPLPLIKKALRLFTSQDRYLLSIQAGRNRVGLDGKAAGKVKLQEAVNAEILLYQRHLTREQKNQRIHVGQLKLVSRLPLETNEQASSSDNA